MAAAGWYFDPLSPQFLRYWDGSGWTEHVGPALPVGPQWPSASLYGTQALTPTPSSDELTIRRIAAYARWSGILWILLGLIQVLTVIAVVAGVWNIFAGFTRVTGARKIAARDPTVPASFEGVAGLVIIGVINLVLGGFIGLILVGVDFYVRDLVLKNADLFGRSSGAFPTTQLPSVVAPPVTT